MKTIMLFTCDVATGFWLTSANDNLIFDAPRLGNSWAWGDPEEPAAPSIWRTEDGEFKLDTGRGVVSVDPGALLTPTCDLPDDDTRRPLGTLRDLAAYLDQRGDNYDTNVDAYDSLVAA